jgi:hypothetical protein
MPWPTSVHVLKKGGNSPERIQEQEDLIAKMLPGKEKPAAEEQEEEKQRCASR